MGPMPNMDFKKYLVGKFYVGDVGYVGEKIKNGWEFWVD